MANYKIEDFKKWLNADPNRGGGLNMENNILSNKVDDAFLEAIISGKRFFMWGLTPDYEFDNEIWILASGWRPYRQVYLNWAAEIKNKVEEEKEDMESKIKQLLGLKKSDSLPTNWNEQLIKKAETSKNDQELIEKQKEINTKKSELEAKEVELTKVIKERDELQTKVNNIQDQLNNATDGTLSADLQKQLDQAKKDLDLKRTQAKLKIVEKSRNKTKDELKRVQDDYNAKLKEQLNWQTQKVKLEKELATEKANFAKEKNLREQVEKDLDGVKDENIEEYKRLHEEINNLQSRINQLLADKNQLIAQIQVQPK